MLRLPQHRAPGPRPAREPPNLVDLSRGSQLSQNRRDCTATCARLPSARARMICLIIEIFVRRHGGHLSHSAELATTPFRVTPQSSRFPQELSSSAAVVWTYERSISPDAKVIGPFLAENGASTAPKTRRCSFAAFRRVLMGLGLPPIFHLKYDVVDLHAFKALLVDVQSDRRLESLHARLPGAGQVLEGEHVALFHDVTYPRARFPPNFTSLAPGLVSISDMMLSMSASSNPSTRACRAQNRWYSKFSTPESRRANTKP